MGSHQNRRSIFARERIDIYFSDLDKDFSFILGRVNYTRAHHPLNSHVHKNSMEIVYIDKGQQVYTVDETDYTVNSGEVFVTFADEVHSTGHYPEDKSLLYYFVIDLEKHKQGLIGYDCCEGDHLIQALMNIKKRVFRGCSKLKVLLDTVILNYYSECPYKKTVIRNQISSFLMCILDCEQQSRTEGTEDRSGMCVVLDYIQENITEDIDMTILAKIAGLSMARFKSSFRQQIGIPPREYILRQKVEEARKLLASTELTITDIAHKLSFSSSQYFSTVFKRFTFMNPNKFRTGCFKPELTELIR